MPFKKGSRKLTPEQVEQCRENGRKNKGKRHGVIYEGRLLKPGEKIDMSIFEKPLVLEELKFYVQIQATAEEIASHYGMSPDTLDRRLKEHLGVGFAEFKAKLKDAGKLALRMRLWSQAKDNSNMAKHLAEEWLGHNAAQKMAITQTIEVKPRKVLRLPDNGVRSVKTDG